jgi:hypothetical protein
VRPGSNTVTRSSVDSTVTVKSENLFHQLANLDRDPTRMQVNANNQKSACGCGWPQHLLITRGTPAGMPFDLFVIITDGDADGLRNQNAKTCRDAMSFCGILDEKFPDRRPMGYPFDRVPYNDPMMPNTRVNSLIAYARNIPNSGIKRVIIRHDPSPPKVMENTGAPPGMKIVNEMGQVMSPPSQPRPPHSNQVQPPTNDYKGGRQFQGRPSQSDPWAPVPPRVAGNQQWGGPGRQQNSGRKSRQDSDSWEHLEAADYDDDYMEN